MTMKRLFSVFSAIVAVFVLATCFFGCVKPADGSGENGFVRHTKIQSDFLLSDASYIASIDSDGKSENSRPLPLRLDVKDKKSGYSIVIKQKDGKISLSMKALVEEKEAEEEPEEKIELPKSEAIGTSLGDLFKNLKF